MRSARGFGNIHLNVSLLHNFLSCTSAAALSFRFYLFGASRGDFPESLPMACDLFR